MKPSASLSLDLDNQWSYMKTHGDAGWQDYPSYLDVLIPQVLDFFHARNQSLTFFIVGQDAALDKNRQSLAMISAAGHEVGNHSFKHEPWLHKYTPTEVADELGSAADAIERAVGVRPRGFRGPGFSVNSVVLQTLLQQGYEYDCSTFPTYIGPLARAYYFMAANLSKEEQEDRDELFGSVSDGLRPVTPYYWDIDGEKLLEVPVTTIPGLKAPFHLSYILYLSSFSPLAARAYFSGALRACKVAGVEPSLLLHPLDFLGADDVANLAFFPGMQMPGDLKRERVSQYLEDMARLFDIVPMGEHARRIADKGGLATRRPDFGDRDLPPAAVAAE